MLVKFLFVVAVSFCSPALAQMLSSDVDRFYKVYDATNGRPGANDLQQGYLDGGTKALQDFKPGRIVSAAHLAEKIASNPETYVNARRCISALESLRNRLPRLIDKLRVLYPQTRNPRVTFVIGARNSAGTVSADGIIVGLEVVCENRTNSKLSLEDRLIVLVAHELVHTQQHGFAGGTLLAASLNEGVAEFVGELISGQMVNEHLREWTMGKEAVLKARFQAEMNKTGYTGWLYNGTGTPEAPGDLGYWFGYAIAKNYYARSADKPAAIIRLLESSDAPALVRDSGW